MKNSAALIISVSILILIAVFTLQNAQMARIQFLFWTTEASLSLILFITFAVGILSAVIVLLPVIYRLKGHRKNDDRKNTIL